jgi:hypothetical protein
MAGTFDVVRGIHRSAKRTLSIWRWGFSGFNGGTLPILIMFNATQMGAE